MDKHTDDCECTVCDPPRKPFWRCEECGFKDEKKLMPADRKAHFSREQSLTCPRCKSIGFVPVGF